MINLNNVAFEAHNIKNINLNIKKGDKVMLTGSNGSGKTTILHILAKLIKPTSGIITLNYDSVGLIFQNPEDQFLFSTVKEELIFILENKNIEPEIMDKLINDVLKTVELSIDLNMSPFNLSGGQKQKLALACNLLLEPTLLLLDEATSMLDFNTKTKFLELIVKVCSEKKITLVSVTHEYDEYMYYDYALEITNGVIKKVVPKDLNFNFGKKEINEALIEVKDLSYQINNKVILNSFNTSFYKNNINGIVGEIGCGKTTLINHFNGINKIQTGTIKINNIELDTNTSKKEYANLYKTLTTVYQFPENQLFCYTNREEILFSPKNYKIKVEEKLINYYLKLFNLEIAVLDKSPFELSGGEKRKIAIISSLVMQSDILIFDEPFVGIDNITKVEMLKLFKELSNTKTIIIITHDNKIINNYCDYVVALGAK